MVSYKPLWMTMEKQGISTYTLIEQHGINPRTINNLKHNRGFWHDGGYLTMPN